MSIFLEVITIEHESEHDLSRKSNFSTPKIYAEEGGFFKVWYVYSS